VKNCQEREAAERAGPRPTASGAPGPALQYGNSVDPKRADVNQKVGTMFHVSGGGRNGGLQSIVKRAMMKRQDILVVDGPTEVRG
jgi:hypothetical protein